MSTTVKKSHKKQQPASTAAKSSKASSSTESKVGSKESAASTPELGRRVIKPPAKFDDDYYAASPTPITSKKTPVAKPTASAASKFPLRTKPTIQHAAVTAAQKEKSSVGQTIVTRPVTKKSSGVEMEKKPSTTDITKKKLSEGGPASKGSDKKAGEERKGKASGASEKVVAESLDNLRVVLSPITSKDGKDLRESQTKHLDGEEEEKKSNVVGKKPPALLVKKPASPAQTPKAAEKESPQSPGKGTSTVKSADKSKSDKVSPSEQLEIDREAIIAKAMAMLKKDKPGSASNGTPKVAAIPAEKAYGQTKERKILTASPSVNVTKVNQVPKVKPKPKVDENSFSIVKRNVTKKSIKGNILYERMESGEIVARLARDSDIKELAAAKKSAKTESPEEKRWSPEKIYDCPITEENVENVIDRTISSTAAMRQLLCSFKDDLRRTGVGIGGSAGFEASDEATQQSHILRRQDIATKLADAFVQYQTAIDEIAEFGRLPPLDFTSGNWNISEVDHVKPKKAGGSVPRKRGIGGGAKFSGGGKARSMGRVVMEKRMRLSAGESSMEGIMTSDDSNSSWGDVPLSSPSPPPPPPKAKAPKPPKPPVEPEAVSDDLWMSCECISDDEAMNGIGVGFTNRVR